MRQRLLLILDDDRARLRGFEEIAARLGDGWAVKAWRDAPTMIAEVDRHLPAAGLISLDNDLYKDFPADADPGSGRAVAEHLCRYKAVCPVIVHSTNTDAAWGMHNSLRAAGWPVEIVHHLSQPKWIEELWLPAAARVVSAYAEPRGPAKGAVLSIAEYRALARSLWPPTLGQQRDFAVFVAGAHSWYKHLKILPAKTPLQFFLDPAAGMQRVQTADGTVSVVPREEHGFHYSWLPTAQYRKRFGYLAFSRDAGSRVALIAADGSQQIGADDTPCIYDPVARAFHGVPEQVLTAGRAYVSGIVHELASRKSIWEWVIRDNERFDDILERIDGLEVNQRILERCALLKHHPSRAEPAPLQEKDGVDRFSLAALDFPLHQLVNAERRRQIDGMVAAIARVLRLVGYGGGEPPIPADLS